MSDTLKELETRARALSVEERARLAEFLLESLRDAPLAESFAEETFCERRVDWSDAARRFDYAPLDTIRLIQ